MTTEPGPVEREAELQRLLRRVQRAARRGDMAGFERASAEYETAKRAHMEASEREQRVRLLARRASRAAVRPSPGSERAWRLPRGFSSPLAAERARTGWQERREPVRPARVLRPWGGESPGQRALWRP